jgi:hypothetical protein
MKPRLASLLFLPLVAHAANPDALPALAPAYGELPPTFWEQHHTAMAVAGFAVIAFAFLFLKVMLRPETPVVLPPEILARRALAKLQSQPEDGKTLSDVSQILRRYVVAVFQLPSTEMTTAEFSAALAGNEKTGPELAMSISFFLRECDERKFSTASAAAPMNAVARALELIALAERHMGAAGLMTPTPPTPATP